MDSFALVFHSTCFSVPRIEDLMHVVSSVAFTAVRFAGWGSDRSGERWRDCQNIKSDVIAGGDRCLVERYIQSVHVI